MPAAFNSGNLYCWGWNGHDEDGPTSSTTPLQVGTLATWTAVSQGGNDTCGLAAGKLYCWGYNQYGEDGIGNTTLQANPIEVGTAPPGPPSRS